MTDPKLNAVIIENNIIDGLSIYFSDAVEGKSWCSSAKLNIDDDLLVLKPMYYKELDEAVSEIKRRVTEAIKKYKLLKE